MVVAGEVLTNLAHVLPWAAAAVGLRQVPRIINAWTVHRLSRKLVDTACGEKRISDKRFAALTGLIREMDRNRAADSRASRNDRDRDEPEPPE